jgi:hypothetical protein
MFVLGWKKGWAWTPKVLEHGRPERQQLARLQSLYGLPEHVLRVWLHRLHSCTLLWLGMGGAHKKNGQVRLCFWVHG